MRQVYAQVSVIVENPLQGRFDTIGHVFGFVINLLIGVGWSLVFVMLALGFIQYILSKGEKSAVDRAQKWLTYSILGGVGLYFIPFVKTLIPRLLGADSLLVNNNEFTFEAGE